MNSLQPLKPGITTTEFGITAISVGVSMLIAFLCTKKIIAASDADTVTGLATAAVMGAISLLSNVVKIRGYVQSRTVQKMGPEQLTGVMIKGSDNVVTTPPASVSLVEAKKTVTDQSIVDKR